MSNEAKCRVADAVCAWQKSQVSILEDKIAMPGCNTDDLQGRIEVLNSLAELIVEAGKPGGVVTDREVIDAMKAHGGKFVQALAELFLCGDPDNRAMIKTTWKMYWDMYWDIAIKLRVPHANRYVVACRCRKCGGPGTEKRVMDMNYFVCEDCNHQWKG